MNQDLMGFLVEIIYLIIIIIINIYRIQEYDSIMYGYFCNGFINFMFNGNSLTDYTNLFSPNDLKKKR